MKALRLLLVLVQLHFIYLNLPGCVQKRVVLCCSPRYGSTALLLVLIH